jgi:hypothetical protein
VTALVDVDLRYDAANSNSNNNTTTTTTTNGIDAMLATTTHKPLDLGTPTLRKTTLMLFKLLPSPNAKSIVMLPFVSLCKRSKCHEQGGIFQVLQIV